MKKVIRLATAAFAVMALSVLSGCKIQKTVTPPLTGPSEMATSIRLTANPDVLRQDGASQSQITIEARDATGQPKSDLAVRVEITVGGVFTDYGQLSAKNLVTGRDGRAYATYTAPAPSSDPVDYGTVVTILVTPTEYDFANTWMRQVSIRLVPPGIILPPNNAPTAAFSFSPGSPNERQTIQFDASASSDVDGTIVSYSWNFGDGTSATGVTTTHAYDSGGTYTVSLTVTDDRGAVASATQSITVFSTSAPTAIFTLSPSNPAINETVFFNAAGSSAASGRSITSYSWDFGDGRGGSGVSPSHAYTSIGTFVVTLTVKDDVGRTGATSNSVAVGAALTPTATIVVSPTGVNVDQTVNFDGSLSTAPAGRTLTSYEWSFGDGTSATGVKVDHRYRVAGTFSVVLTVTDNTGAIDRASATVLVSGGTTPTAQFSFAPAAPVVNQMVRFDGSESTSAGGKTISTYEWNFGDGGVATGVQTFHTFTIPGTFSVVLTVTDSSGLKGAISRQVVVSTGAPTASFTVSPTSPVVNQLVSFDGRASSAVSGKTITSWSWNFGDNSALGSGSQATHTYTTAGTYAVALTVTDSSNQTGATSQNVTVGSGLPTASFTFAPTSPGVGQTVNFDATPSTAPAGRTITSYAWQFGDGTTGTGVRPSKTYSAAGQFTVVLTVTDSASLTATTSQAITVTTGVPTASFNVSPEPGNQNQVSVADASASTAAAGSTISTYEWNFGDTTNIYTCPVPAGGNPTPVPGQEGTTACGSTNRTVSHTYTRTGTYTISLTVTDSLLRKASTTKTHVVN